MITIKKDLDTYYNAFMLRDATYDGVFYTGVKTTGIFCLPSCPARKPKRENCDFFKSVQECLLAGYRACKRCRPTAMPGEATGAMKQLIDAIEHNPTYRWCDQDVRERGLDHSTVRRQFKKRFGMTFVAYARARRMGMALKTIREGDKVINAQLDAGFESGSGFRDAFTKILGAAPKQSKQKKILYADWIDTPVGAMIVMGDDTYIHLLEFTDRRGLEKEIDTMRTRYGIGILPGKTAAIQSMTKELSHYFAGRLKTFETPLYFYGSDFQKAVIKGLCDIPYGETRSYKQQAEMLGNPKAVRAVARANGMNQIAIAIPCHRVIGSDGALVGYAGGMARKKYLLSLEASIREKSPE